MDVTLDLAKPIVITVTSRKDCITRWVRFGFLPSLIFPSTTTLLPMSNSNGPQASKLWRSVLLQWHSSWSIVNNSLFSFDRVPRSDALCTSKNLSMTIFLLSLKCKKDCEWLIWKLRSLWSGPNIPITRLGQSFWWPKSQFKENEELPTTARCKENDSLSPT